MVQLGVGFAALLKLSAQRNETEKNSFVSFKCISQLCNSGTARKLGHT